MLYENIFYIYNSLQAYDLSSLKSGSLGVGIPAATELGSKTLNKTQ